MKRACANCDYFFGYGETPNEPGECRLKSPTLIMVKHPIRGAVPGSAWPPVNPASWCGEFRTRDDITPVTRTV